MNARCQNDVEVNPNRGLVAHKLCPGSWATGLTVGEWVAIGLLRTRRFNAIKARKSLPEAPENTEADTHTDTQPRIWIIADFKAQNKHFR